MNVPLALLAFPLVRRFVKPDRPGSAELLRLIKAKLHAFLDSPASTLAGYPPSDTSELARYARAIAYYRVPDVPKALPAIDGLIRDCPAQTLRIASATSSIGISFSKYPLAPALIAS